MPPAYEGGKPYIFISYAHKDTELVMPAIEALQAQGYPVWYDAGIQVGTEWPEYIAEHLLHCSLVVAFISEASIASPNCRQEIVYALDKRKHMITVRLDDAQMPPGMEMQLNLCQSLFAYKHDTLEGYVTELARAPYIAECLNLTPPTSVEQKTEADSDHGKARTTCSFDTKKASEKKKADTDEEVPAIDLLERISGAIKGFFDTKDTHGEYKSIDVRQNKVMAVLCYLGLLILIPLLLMRSSKYVRFHLNQGLLFLALCVAYNLVTSLLSLLTGGVFFFLLPLGDVLLLGLLILQIVRVVQDQSRELPLIGRIRILD